MRSPRFVHCFLLCVGLVAADPSDPASALLAEAKAASQARSEQAAATSAWRGERDRLQAAISAAGVEADRLRSRLSALQQAADADQHQATELSATSSGRAVGALDRATVSSWASLRRLAAECPPGAISVPATASGEAGVSALIRAIDAAERAAAQVAVEVVSGRLDQGEVRAVKLLRVSGAACWWLSLDGREAGIADITTAGLLLRRSDDSNVQAIQRAVAIVEGRQSSALVPLPDPVRP